jgi:hypothetical protein
VASLESEHGAQAHWIIDDECYVLVLSNRKVDDMPGFKMTPWLFPEALAVLRRLPPLKGEDAVARVRRLPRPTITEEHKKALRAMPEHLLRPVSPDVAHVLETEMQRLGQVEEPELSKDPLASDHEFLGYCELHCKTERALFSKQHIDRLMRLAGGLPTTDSAEWRAMHEDVAMPLIKEARSRLTAEKLNQATWPGKV